MIHENEHPYQNLFEIYIKNNKIHTLKATVHTFARLRT